MAAYVFLASSTTEHECLQRLLLGTNPGKVQQQTLSKLAVGDFLFLYNYDACTLRGPFTALTPLTHNLEPNAWKGASTKGFPWQVKVSDAESYLEPLQVKELERALSLHPATIHGNAVVLPPAELDESQLRSVLEALAATNSQEAGPPKPPPEATGSAYIFKCDRRTGGRCFSANIMGAPMQLYQGVVSRVQAGATVFLWQMDERTLYGVWRAKSRGQYDPTAFAEAPEGSFHAVVFCERRLRFEEGIDEKTLRGIVAYDGPRPPYIIQADDAERITEALAQANNSFEDQPGLPADVGKYLAEDGHRVRSQGELIIDNLLFSRGALHAYERRVQLRDRFLRCDFYLPPAAGQQEVYVEYWGMMGDREYDRRREQKLAIYRRAGITPLELFPRDVYMLAEVWPAKMAAFRRD